MEHTTHQTAENGVTTERKVRDAGVYFLLYRTPDQQLAYEEYSSKREASLGYTKVVEAFGPNAVERFYKQAKPVQVRSRVVAQF